MFKRSSMTLLLLLILVFNRAVVATGELNLANDSILTFPETLRLFYKLPRSAFINAALSANHPDATVSSLHNKVERGYTQDFAKTKNNTQRERGATKKEALRFNGFSSAAGKQFFWLGRQRYRLESESIAMALPLSGVEQMLQLSLSADRLIVTTLDGTRTEYGVGDVLQ